MIVLGIDPGATVGLALLDVPTAGRPTWLWHEVIRADELSLANLQWADRVPDQIVIEQVAGYAYDHARSAALIETARLEGRLIEQARALGYEPIMVSRAEWRKALCGNGSADDAKVKRALGMQTAAMPRQTNVHARDAAGGAIIGARMAQRVRRTA